MTYDFSRFPAWELASGHICLHSLPASRGLPYGQEPVPSCFPFIWGVFRHNLCFLYKHEPLPWLDNPASLWKRV